MSKTSNPRKQSRARLRLRRGRLALALAMVLMAPAALAGVVVPPTPQPVTPCSMCLPETGTVTPGSGAATSNLDVGVTMNPGPTAMDTMIITQTSPSAIIQWQTFNVATGFSVYFQQPDANSVTLNRVIGVPGVGITPSIIQGSIFANGNVFILNPTGILFGKSSSVNVGGLVASTLDLSDADFGTGFAMADPHYIFTPSIRAGAPIVNQGQLTAAAGGTIALLASRIENQAGATISTPGGSTVFGAARGVNLDFYNDGLTTVTLTGPGYASPYGCAAGMSTSSCLGGIESTGTITAVGGHVEMRTTTDDGLAQPAATPYFTEASNGGRIWIGGSVTAQTSATRAGTIVLDAGMGNIDIGGVSGQTGLVSAYATGSGLNAGTVDIKAYQLFTYVCVGPGGVCATNDSLGWIDATAYGAGGNGGAITINLTGDLYHAGVLQAGAAKGSGGLIDITAAGSAYIHNWITAEGLLGNGGTIDIDAPSIYLYKGQRPWVVGTGTLYSQAVLSAYGSVDGGSVGLDFSTGLYVSDLGDVTPSDPEYAWIINVRGMNGNGGSVTGTGYLIDIGNTWFANANGYRDGGSINLSAGTSVNIAGRLEAMGGRTTDPNVSFGDGGTITISGTSVDLYGQFYADGGSRQSPYPGPSSYGGSVIVSGDYVTLHDGSTFEAVGASGSGWVDTRADYLLLVQGDVSVAAGGWYLGGSEGWIIPNSSLGYYTNGVVVVDQALSTATVNGTGVSVNVDPGKHTGYGNGQIHFITGASITGNGAWGGLDFTATQGIYGNGFTIDANLGRIAMDGGAGAVNLGNFTLDTHGGGGVYVDGSYVLLDNGSIYGWTAQLTATDPTGSGITLDDTSVHASTGNITLDASPSYGSIRIQNGSSVISDSGSVKLDADGSSYGIIVDGSTIQAGGSYLTLESDAGIGINNASSIVSYGGAISLDADASLAGIDIDGSTIYSHGGYIAMHASNTDGGGIRITNGSIVDSDVGGMLLDTSYGDAGIDVDASSLHATFGNITLNAYGSASGILLHNAAAVISDDGGVTLEATASGNGITIDGSSVHAGTGYLTMYADTSAGIHLYNGATVDTDGGSIRMYAADSSYGVVIDAATVASNGGDIQIAAPGYNTGGIWVQNGALIDSGTGYGDIDLDVNGGTLGIQIDNASIHATGGDITLNSADNDGGIRLTSAASLTSVSGAVSLYAPNSGNGVYILGSSVKAGAAGIGMTATNSGNGIRIDNGSYVGSAGGAITLNADFSGYGIYIDDSDVHSNGGAISMYASSSSGGGIWIQNTAVVDSAGGAIKLDVGNGVVGIYVDDATLLSGGGDITLDAASNDQGIHLLNAGSVDSGGGGIALKANNSGTGIEVNEASVDSAGGAIYMGAVGSDGGIHVVYGAAIDSGVGSIVLQANYSTDGIHVDSSTFTSSGGDISMYAMGDDINQGGIWIENASAIDSNGGNVYLQASFSLGGIVMDDSSLHAGGGDVTFKTVYTDAGIDVVNGSMVDAEGGAILFDAHGTGGSGILVDASTVLTSNAGITMDGSHTNQGIRVSSLSNVASAGGAILLNAQDSAQGVYVAGSVIDSGGGSLTLDAVDSRGGIYVNSASLDGNGGDVTLSANGSNTGIRLTSASVIDSAGGDVSMTADDTGYGIVIDYSAVLAGGGAIMMSANRSTYGGIYIGNDATVGSAGGDITMDADDSAEGLLVSSATVSSGAGNMVLSAQGTGAGIALVDGDLISTAGNIELAGYNTSGAGVGLDAGSSIDAGSGMVIVRAGNDGSSDAIIIDGAVSSTTGVNLRPLDEADAIYLGNNNGFSISSSDFSNITSPLLVIGSNLQAGQIQVLEDVAFDGDLTLQNQGASAGIHLGGSLDVGLHTLGLLSGGSIVQTSTAAIHAESLLAIAGGDVLLATAQNDVSGTTLSGNAGGQFEFLDANGLAIGNVNAFGFNTSGNAFAVQAGSGISAGNNVFVQALAGNLTLNGDVHGLDIDLVTSGVLLNPGSHILNASGDWRVWASTWVGEDRGGLAGSGTLPNLYNCTYGGPCGVTVGSGNHFIYTQQPTLTLLIDDASREYGDPNPAFNYSATGLILGDNLAYVLSGFLSSSATSGSNVGQYAISGNFTSPAGYAIAFSPGTLTITPATLLFTADPLVWYMGVPFPNFTGTITGFKNGDTVSSVFGSSNPWFTYATPLSMPGFYAIYGGGNAQNYVFAQAQGNSVALHLLPLSQTSDQPTQFIAERNDTDVYDTNIGQVEMCPVGDNGNDQALVGGDALGSEWSKVRNRLNLLNCFSNDKKGGCGSF